MSRVQLAVNVADLEEAAGFYSKLFGTEPAKVRPGYANFAVAEALTSTNGLAQSAQAPVAKEAP